MAHMEADAGHPAPGSLIRNHNMYEASLPFFAMRPDPENPLVIEVNHQLAGKHRGLPTLE